VFEFSDASGAKTWNSLIELRDLDSVDVIFENEAIAPALRAFGTANEAIGGGGGSIISEEDLLDTAMRFRC